MKHFYNRDRNAAEFLFSFCSATLGLMVVLPPDCISDSAEQPPFVPKSAAAGLHLNAPTPAPPGMRNRPWGTGAARLRCIRRHPSENPPGLRPSRPFAFSDETLGKPARVMPAVWSNEAGFSFAKGFRNRSRINQSAWEFYSVKIIFLSES